MYEINSYKYHSNNIKEFHFHDCHIDEVSQVENDLYIKLNHIDVLVKNKFNTFNSPKQSGRAIMILKEFKLNKVSKDFGTSIDSKEISTISGIIIEDISANDVSNLINDTEILYIDRFEEANINGLHLTLDPYKDHLIEIDILCSGSEIYWNEFVKDSWFANRS